MPTAQVLTGKAARGRPAGWRTSVPFAQFRPPFLRHTEASAPGSPFLPPAVFSLPLFLAGCKLFCKQPLSPTPPPWHGSPSAGGSRNPSRMPDQRLPRLRYPQLRACAHRAWARPARERRGRGPMGEPRRRAWPGGAGRQLRAEPRVRQSCPSCRIPESASSPPPRPELVLASEALSRARPLGPRPRDQHHVR